MENKIYFNFSYLALKLLGSGLYSNPWNAISELIANGFDAGASDVFIHIDSSDKGHSTIEIFDNGSGMSYEDLASKYVFVGRNKRLDENYDFKSMGRKGIGKLATLYLSDNVYIISKNNHNISAWNLNISSLNDDERPSLNYVDYESIKLICEDQWNSIESGLLLKLVNVNLVGLGEKTLEGLINRLSNFYLFDVVNKRVWLSYTESNDGLISFQQVKKSVADKNFYALFNNSNVIFDGFENRRVKIKTEFKELEIGYPTVLIKETDFVTNGKSSFLNLNGEIVEKSYSLIGWIGIHTSINVNEARKNDYRFVKNSANNPNKLRLYIRGKLAVENFLDYVKNTQAFSNYIEGEISFDILDDDDLPDITTANRQQISEKDDRVQLLINILKPIITRLISLRVALSKTLSDDEEKIRQQKINEISVKHESEKKRLEGELEKTQVELDDRREQVKILSKGLHKNTVRLAEAIHTINKISVTIDGNINRIYDKYLINDKSVKRVLQDLSKISLLNSRILLLTKYATNANFALKSKIIDTDLGLFVKQYFDVINYAKAGFTFVYSFNENTDLMFSFDSTALGIILDNILSNSIKAKATELSIDIRVIGEQASLSFADNGEGYDHEMYLDPDVFFELGFRASKEKGLGIGLYHIKNLIDSNKGSVLIDREYKNGFKIDILLNKM